MPANVRCAVCEYQMAELRSSSPELAEQGPQLVGERHATLDEVIACADEAAQCLGLVGGWREGAEPMAVGAQQVAEQVRVAEVRLALGRRIPGAGEGPADRSLLGAPRRERRGATSCCRTRSPALSKAAGLTMAVERLATKAVLGEAPEDLLFTLADFDREVNFLAPTRGGCTSELGAGAAAARDPPRLRPARGGEARPRAGSDAQLPGAARSAGRRTAGPLSRHAAAAVSGGTVGSCEGV